MNKENEYDVKNTTKKVKAYCNCCGKEFAAYDDIEIVCPMCGCEYSEYNNYIEIYYE